MSLSLVCTFRDLAVGDTFTFRHENGARYVKLDARTYQLLDRVTGEKVPHMTYALGWRGGQDDQVLIPTRKAA